MLVNRQTFRTFVSNKVIVCRTAYAHIPLCIHASTALLKRLYCPADNSMKRLCNFDKNKCLTRK